MDEVTPVQPLTGTPASPGRPEGIPEVPDSTGRGVSVSAETGHHGGMPEHSTDWPGSGTVTIEWQESTVDGHPRFGWSYRSEPLLDPSNAIVLLRNCADELELDLPE